MDHQCLFTLWTLIPCEGADNHALLCNASLNLSAKNNLSVYEIVGAAADAHNGVSDDTMMQLFEIQPYNR